MSLSEINNTFYDDLGSQWESACDHPIALLRSENSLRNPWIASLIEKEASVLDIGCGAGLLTNNLAARGVRHVTGIDMSLGALQTASLLDTTKNVVYKEAKAEQLPFEANSFDVVCAMDLLEHVEKPELVIAEAARVLKPRGIFFFHTFNRNLLSYLLIIKGVEKFVVNTPKNLHVYPLFIKPKELEAMMKSHELTAQEWKGIRPVVRQKGWWQLLRKGTIHQDFRFRFVKSLATGYCGYSIKS